MCLCRASKTRQLEVAAPLQLDVQAHSETIRTKTRPNDLGNQEMYDFGLFI